MLWAAAVLVGAWFWACVAVRMYRMRGYLQALRRRMEEREQSDSSVLRRFFSKESDELLQSDVQFDADLADFERSVAQGGGVQDRAPSVVGKVSGESAVLLGGAMALLMQLAHPYVALAVSSHSYLQSLAGVRRRFLRTFKYVFDVSFGDWQAAQSALHEVRKIHKSVHGVFTEDLPGGGYKKGETFDALSEWGAFWVYATLVWNAVVIYELFCGHLSDADRNAYTESQMRCSQVWGIRWKKAPKTWDELDSYVCAMSRSNYLTSSAPALRYASFLLLPIAVENWLPLPRTNETLGRLATPPGIAAHFGLVPSLYDWWVGLFFLSVYSVIYCALPERIRHLTRYRLMLHRLRGEKEELDWLENIGCQTGLFILKTSMK